MDKQYDLKRVNIRVSKDVDDWFTDKSKDIFQKRHMSDLLTVTDELAALHVPSCNNCKEVGMGIVINIQYTGCSTKI